MKITRFENGMYRVKYNGLTAIAPSLGQALDALWLHIGGCDDSNCRHKAV